MARLSEAMIAVFSELAIRMIFGGKGSNYMGKGILSQPAKIRNLGSFLYTNKPKS